MNKQIKPPATPSTGPILDEAHRYSPGQVRPMEPLAKVVVVCSCILIAYLSLIVYAGKTLDAEGAARHAIEIPMK